jgi:lysophospholipase L1-like esterase
MKILLALKAAIGKVLLAVFSTGMILVLLEFSIRLFFLQPINYYNFTLIQADGGGHMVLGSSLSSRQQRPKGYGPYVPHLSTKFGAVAVTINSRGWRDAEYSLEKPQGATRLMVVGDSVVFGYGVEMEDMFPKVLERELNSQAQGHYEVISLGGAASHTHAQKNMIKDNVSVNKPDLVILAFNLNDILPAVTDNAPAPDTRRFMAGSILRLRKRLDAAFRSNSHLYFMLRERIKIVLRKFAIASPTMLPLGAFDIESDYGIAAWRDTREALLEIAAHLKHEQIPFLLAILPVEMQMSPEVADLYRREYGFTFADSLVNGKPQEWIRDFAEQQGIAYVDLLTAFRRNPSEQKFFRVYGGSIDWNHPNRRGHKIIAEELKRALDDFVWPSRTNGRPSEDIFYKG